MPTAPRFTPTGMTPSQMPTPEVRPSSAAASALNTLGETIASLGQSADFYQRAKERQAQVRSAALEAAASDAAAKYEIDMDGAFRTFETDAQGVKIGDARTALDEKLNGDKSAYLEGLDPDAKLAFERKAALINRKFSMLGNNVAHARSGAFIVSTEKANAQRAILSAGRSRVAQDDVGFSSYLTEAARSYEAVAKITGEPVSYADISDSAELVGLEEVIRQGHNEIAAEYYERAAASNRFGSRKAEAEKMIAPVMDTVWVDRNAAPIVSGAYDNVARQEDGSVPIGMDGAVVFNAQKARDVVAQMTGKDVTDERKAKLLKRIDDQEKQDEQRRKDLGDSVLASLQAAQQASPTAASSLMNSTQVQAALRVMPQQAANAIMERSQRGPEYSKPEHYTALRSVAMRDPRAFQSVNLTNYVLSRADYDAFMKLKAEGIPEAIPRIYKQVEAVIEAGGMYKVPTAKEGETLKGKDAVARQRVDIITQALFNDMEKDRALRESYDTAPDKDSWIRGQVSRRYLPEARRNISGGFLDAEQEMQSTATIANGLLPSMATPEILKEAGLAGKSVDSMTMAEKLRVAAVIQGREDAKLAFPDPEPVDTGPSVLDRAGQGVRGVFKWIQEANAQREEALGFR